MSAARPGAAVGTQSTGSPMFQGRPEILDFSHFLGLDRFGAKPKVGTVFGPSTQEVSFEGTPCWA